MDEPLTVVGGSVASLATALAAARRGRRVTLYVDRASIGGSFAGTRVQVGEEARRFDLGPRLFELDYEGADRRPISAYDTDCDNHRAFIQAVAAFVHDILQDDVRPAPVPEMWFADRRTRCVFMTVDLSDLPAALRPEDRVTVLEQARRVMTTWTPSATDDLTLEQASLAQHGALLHALLTEAMCMKQYADWRCVPACERRKLWMSLFHPRTVFEAFSGIATTFRPHRPFSTTRVGAAYPFVDRLFASVRASDRITVVDSGRLTGFATAPSGTARLAFGANRVAVPSERCVIGVPPEQLFAAAGLAYAPERITSSIIWVDVAERDTRAAPSTLMICDPGLRALRLSSAGCVAGRQTFAVEFGGAPACPDIAAAVLRRTGLVADSAELRVVHRLGGPAQVAPTPANRIAFETARNALPRFRGVLLGGARRFGFDGLNDQIADALYFGATRC